VQGIFFAGELSLNGELNGIHGILGMVEAAKAAGCRACIIPDANAREGGMIQGIEVYGAKSLVEVKEHLLGEQLLTQSHINIEEIFQKAGQKCKLDFADIRGQKIARRAAEISAAGRHNLLISGPPGTGKSMIAKRIPSILPLLTMDEALEVSRIHSVAGTLPEDGILCERPFRMPHHTISSVGLTGGGSVPHPGEISLAHRGILYLDELPEFQKDVLEILRQPMEDGQVCITRSSGSYLFPADFILVASRNPCKCGYFPDRSRCHCSQHEVMRYLHRISRPLLDRIDIHVEAEPVSYEELMSREPGECSAVIRARVQEVHRIQMERYQGSRFRFNGELTPDAVAEYCNLDDKGKALMESVYENKHLTARTYHRILKVARTIADLDGSDSILVKHLSEAVCYRPGEELQ
jgi:magnesium chelatase family protein